MRASGGVIVIMVATAHAQPTYTPVYQPPADPLADHYGRQFEVDCGFAYQSGHAQNLRLVGAVGGVCGIEGGFWFGRRVNIDVRVIGGESSSNEGSVANVFIGPTAQVWFDENLWAGVGIGAGMLGIVNCGYSCFDGPAFELRVGASFGNSAAADGWGPRHRATISIEAIDSEVSGGQYNSQMTTTPIHSISLLVGYMQL